MQSLWLRIVFFFLHFEKQIILPGLKYGNCGCACREELPGGGLRGCAPRQMRTTGYEVVQAREIFPNSPKK